MHPLLDPNHPIHTPNHASPYGWLITKDHLADEERDEAGVCGPRNISPEMKARLEAGEGKKFRMYDDDDELYYEGVALFAPPDSEDWDGESEFAPLDNFGAPNAGCTRIDYLNDKGEWEQL